LLFSTPTQSRYSTEVEFAAESESASEERDDRKRRDDSVGIPTGVGAVQQSNTQVVMTDGPLDKIVCAINERDYRHVTCLAAKKINSIITRKNEMPVEGTLPLNQTGLYVGTLMMRCAKPQR